MNRPQTIEPVPSLHAHPRSRRTQWIALFLFASTVLLYARCFRYGFIAFDDQQYIQNNEHLRLGLTVAGVRWAMTSLAYANWFPLVWLTYLVDARLFHSSPTSLHVLNVCLHAANASLLFLAIYQLTGRRWRAALVAALFAWHPLRVQSVVWIAETKDVLGGLFFILTLLAYARYAARPGLGRYLLTATAFAGGLMSKPTVVTLPAVLLLLDGWPLRRMRDKTALGCRVLEKLPLLAMAAGASVLYEKAQRTGGALISVVSLPFGLRLKNGIVSVAAYLRQTVWPANLCVFYPHPFFLTRTISTPQVVMVAAGLLVVTLVAVLRWRTMPYLLVGWLWFLGMLLPMSGVLAQAGDQARADRYTYLPSIGLTMLVVWSGADALLGWVPLARARRALATVGSVAVSAALIPATLLQISTWRTTRTLFERADQVVPRNYLAKAVLARDATRAGRLDAALTYGRDAVLICPGLPEPHAAYGAALLEANRPREAYEQLLEAARHDPYNGRVRNDLGRALLALDRPLEAGGQFALAVQFEPGFVEARSNWGVVLASEGDLRNAVTQWTLATGGDPSFGAAQGLLATALDRQGDRRDAIVHYRLAWADGEHRPAWLAELAWLVATDPHTSPEETADAVAAATEAMRQSHPPDPIVLDALAAAEARDGQFDRAASHAADALRLLGNSNLRLSGAIGLRLQLYQSGQPYIAK